MGLELAKWNPTGEIDVEAFDPFCNSIARMPSHELAVGARKRCASWPKFTAPTIPDRAFITFQWFSCPGHKGGCSFSYGARAANRLTKLDIYLGTIFDGTDIPALFYSFGERMTLVWRGSNSSVDESW
jgi:hypothetical protein